MIERFIDRTHAGQLLAERLMEYAGRPDVLVMAMPRGGVPVADEVARLLDVRLTVVLARRFSLPGCPDLALGAVGPHGIVVVNEHAVDGFEVPRTLVDAELADEQDQLSQMERIYAEGPAQPQARGQTVILVDDGLATGTTIRAAIAAVHELGPASIVLAVPIAAPTACVELASRVNEIVCLRAPEPFGKVSDWYQHYPTVSEDEVRVLLAHRQAYQTTPQPAS